MRLPAGVEVVPLAEALAAGHPLVAEIGAIEPARDNAAYALNTAFMSDGAVIRIAGGTRARARRCICASSTSGAGRRLDRDRACSSWSRRALPLTLVEIARRPGRRGASAERRRRDRRPRQRDRCAMCA